MRLPLGLLLDAGMLEARAAARLTVALFCVPLLYSPPSRPLLSARHRPCPDDHFLKWGCYWNRDIAKLVRQAGLEVESESR